MKALSGLHFESLPSAAIMPSGRAMTSVTKKISSVISEPSSICNIVLSRLSILMILPCGYSFSLAKC